MKKWLVLCLCVLILFSGCLITTPGPSNILGLFIYNGETHSYFGISLAIIGIGIGLGSNAGLALYAGSNSIGPVTPYLRFMPQINIRILPIIGSGLLKGPGLGIKILIVTISL